MIPIQPPTATPASAADELVGRYERLKCGVVLISSEKSGSGTKETGTGFFVDEKGTLMTAAHVLFEPSYRLNPDHEDNEKVCVDLAAKHDTFTVHLSEARSFKLNLPAVVACDHNASFDLAFVKTGESTPCHLKVSERSMDPKREDRIRIGEHVISIGFPSLAFDAKSLFEGFVSSIRSGATDPIHIGELRDDPRQGVRRAFPILQIQMPITPGMSGAPLIDDKEEVVGVITEVLLPLPKELAQAIKNYRPQANGVNRKAPSAMMLLEELAWVSVEGLSTGSGIAVSPSVLSSPTPLELILEEY